MLCLLPAYAQGADNATAAEAAAKEALQPLVHPGALIGWTYGREATRGWTVHQRTLSATAGAAPLLSGYTFGEFELRFGFRVDAGAALDILLPESPRGAGLRVSLCDTPGPGCGAIYDGDATLSEGKPIRPAAGLHRATIRRSGDTLSVMIDDAPVASAAIAATRRFGLGLAVARGGAAVAEPAFREPPGEPMVRGNSLAGWWSPGNLGAWHAVNGAIVLKPGGGNYLRSEKLYANFVLTLEYEMEPGCNSGIGLRTPRAGWPSGDGMELQLWDEPAPAHISKHSTMAIYGNVPPLVRENKVRQSNRVVVKADGRMISAWVNGELVQHYDTGDHPELRHRHLDGWIGFQDHGGGIRVRNLRVRETPPGEGLDAWRQARSRYPAAVLVDRLMNPELLARDDGLSGTSSSVQFSGDGSAERVLGQWQGPAALVRIARGSDAGELSFYVDGELRPRWRVKPADMAAQLPSLCDDVNPVLVCMPFARSLKATLRGARSAQYRFDVVPFPAATASPAAAQTPNGDTAQPPPRGWLAAATYRREQFGWGVHRENDSNPRTESLLKSIPPGSTETLVALSGSGVVRWIKLNADKRLYGNPDLWLEATVDGQTQPAVAAPLRFWFPGLAGLENYPNYVLVDRGGVTCMLPMPFGKGLRLAMRNRSQRPAPGVRMTVSVSRPGAARAAGEDAVGPRRLRGVFQSAGQGGDELVRLEGPGRWIGLIHDEPTARGLLLQSLTVDGSPVDGYTNASLGLFYGQESLDFRGVLSGRNRSLRWRYLLLEPVDFHQALVLRANESNLGARLALYYK